MNSDTITRRYVLFETTENGEPVIFYTNGRKTSLPYMDINGSNGDPDQALIDHCASKYGLTPTKFEEIHRSDFKDWDEEEERSYRAIFLNAAEYTGDFPPKSRFVPKEEVYRTIRGIQMSKIENDRGTETQKKLPLGLI